MKKLIILSFALYLAESTFSQNVYTKDGVSLGPKKDFVKSCTSKAKDLIELNGIKIKTDKYCSCVCENLIPQLNSKELTEAYESGTLVELFTQEENFQYIIDCIENNYKIVGDHQFRDSKNLDQNIEIGIKTCILQIKNDPSSRSVFTDEAAEYYCTCTIEKLFKSGYSLTDLDQVSNPESEIFQEIIMPCYEEAMKKE